jgi:hypothetical protein
MPDGAQDLRAQGEHCIRLAKECPTPSVSESLMALAADYFERAARLSSKPTAQQQQQQQIQPKNE